MWRVGEIGAAARVAMCVLAATATAHADGASKDSAAPDLDRLRVDLRVDVVPIINHGFGAWAGIKPPGSAHWTFGAGVFGFRQQSALTNLLQPSNEGIEVRKLSEAAVVRYFFLLDPIPHLGVADTSARGLFASGYAGYLRKTVSFEGAETRLDELFLAVDVGYRYFPFGRIFFIEPSVGFEGTPKLGGDASLGTRSYAESIGEPIVFLGVGGQM